MPVPKEELVKDLDTPEYQAIVKETLAKKEFAIRDKTEESTFLDNYKKDVIEKELPTRIKAVHDQYDKDTKELFGMDRDANEKSYDYLKRAGKTKLGELNASADKIKELEAAIAKGDTSAAMKKKLEEEEANWKTKVKQYEQRIKDLETETQVTSKAADVKLLYGEIKKTFVKTLPPMFSKAESATLSEAISNSIAKDGKLYMANPDGTVRRTKTYEEITVEDFLKAEFKDVIEEKRKTGGAGSPPGGGNDPIDPTKITPDTFEKPDNVKTKVELTEYMIGLGIKQGTPLFNHIWRKYGVPMAV